MAVYELGQIPKDPDAKLPYKIDWSEWLSVGDSILTSDFFILPNDGTLVVLDKAIDGSGKITIVWLANGTPGRTYVVTNRIKTVVGASHDEGDDRSFEVVVRNR
jgi:hypothetical protein